jgi:hypothetical protein
LKGNQESGTVVSFAALAIISRIITVITSITLYTEFGACPPPPPSPTHAHTVSMHTCARTQHYSPCL